MKALRVTVMTLSMIVLIFFLWMVFIFYQIFHAMLEILH